MSVISIKTFKRIALFVTYWIFYVEELNFLKQLKTYNIFHLRLSRNTVSKSSENLKVNKVLTIYKIHEKSPTISQRMKWKK